VFNATSRNEHRGRIHERIRRRMRGTAQRPRLCVFRSLKHLYVQVVDDESGRTLVAASTSEKDCSEGHGKNLKAAKGLGKLIAGRAVEKGIQQVVFDRSGYLYHGRVRAVAEAAREGGLKF
jgi:large subunit ribosomal protein L18